MDLGRVRGRNGGEYKQDTLCDILKELIQIFFKCAHVYAYSAEGRTQSPTRAGKMLYH